MVEIETNIHAQTKNQLFITDIERKIHRVNHLNAIQVERSIITNCYGPMIFNYSRKREKKNAREFLLF